MNELETKAGAVSSQSGTAFDGFMSTFEAFQEANDERLAQLEAKMSADAVTVDKVERINAALTEQKSHLDRLALKAGDRSWVATPARPSTSTSPASTPTCATATRRACARSKPSRWPSRPIRMAATSCPRRSAAPSAGA